MSRNYCLILVNIVSLLSISCRKEPQGTEEATVVNNFNQVFQSYWDHMNSNYVYWDIDSTNWDVVYKTYQPLFAKLDINKNVDVQTSFTYFQAITKNLIDGHYSIDFENSDLAGRYIYPAEAKKTATPGFHSAFNYLSADTNYLDKGFRTGNYVTSDNKRLQVISGMINGTIGYFNCNICYLKECFSSNVKSGAKSTIQYFLDTALRLSSTKGIIIDLRNNPGGNLEDLNFFAGQFIDKPLQIGFSKYKNGSGRLDYTPWISTIINPADNAGPVNMSIIVLADNFTISVAETIAMALHCLPNCKILGEQTWGATGPITNEGIYNAGPFDITGFLSVYTSSAAFKYIDGKIYEGKGFPPDLPVTANSAAIANENDQMLQAAISYLKTN